jgi:3D (Asp-Asp-Asp) domain-containing protein
MSKPLLGGSAAAIVLLSATLLFQAQPSVAETLAVTSQDIRQKSDARGAKAPGTEVSPTSEIPAETGDANNTEKPNTISRNAPETAGDTSETDAGTQASTTPPALAFTATAYSLRGRTASGRPVSRGVIAADRRVLPIGTRVRLEAGSYSGEYLVADTGGAVRGRKIDIWVPNSGEAMRFGRRPIKLTVMTRTRPLNASPRGRR